jgi:hypothetical protein
MEDRRVPPKKNEDTKNYRSATGTPEGECFTGMKFRTKRCNLASQNENVGVPGIPKLTRGPKVRSTPAAVSSINNRSESPMQKQEETTREPKVWYYRQHEPQE